MIKKSILFSLFLFNFFFGVSVVMASDCQTEFETCKTNASGNPTEITNCENKKQACEATVTSSAENVSVSGETSSEGSTDVDVAAENTFNSKFDPDKIFPSWDRTENKVQGVIGRNRRDGAENGVITPDEGDTKILLYFIPKLTSILFRVVAPIIVIMFIYSGVRFIYAGDDEEELKKSKSFFQYALMGIVFIIFAYSAMKSIYYILAENTPLQDAQAIHLELPKNSPVSSDLIHV